MPPKRKIAGIFVQRSRASQKKQDVQTNAWNSVLSNERLSEEQRYAIGMVRERKNVFITGSGGVGKTFLIECIVQALKKDGGVLITASTGIAAVPIGGRTLHAALGCGLAQDSVEECVKRMRRRKDVVARWKRTRCLLIDEISMIEPDFFSKASAIVAHVRNARDKPFGGMQVVLSGDFCQLPPVSGNAFCFESAAWNELKLRVVELTTVFRQQNDVGFVEALGRLRFGRQTSADVELFRSRVNATCRGQSDDGIRPSTLFARNKDVEVLNNEELDRIDGESVLFACRLTKHVRVRASSSNTAAAAAVEKRRRVLALTDTSEAVETLNGEEFEANQADADDGEGEDFGGAPSGESWRALPPVGYLEAGSDDLRTMNDFNRSLSVENRLSLKVGALVLLVINLDFEQGLVNGSQGRVIGFKASQQSTLSESKSGVSVSTSNERLPVVRFANGRERVIERHSWRVPSPDPDRTMYYYDQVPIRLAWAVTIHRSQGMTLDRAVMDLGQSIFAPGQAYVALSRVRDIGGLSLTAFTPENIRTDSKVVAFYDKLKSLARGGDQTDD